MTTTKKLAGDATALRTAQNALSKVDTAARPAADALLNQVAGSDGNRYLSTEEGQRFADAFDAAATKAGHALTASDVAALAKTVLDDVQARLGAKNLDGVSAYFNSAGTDLESKVVEALRSTVAAANGRPVDFDVLIFQFQSQPIADELVNICKANPNVHVRLIGDFSQTSETGSNQLPKLAALKLPNIEVRYKKDNPYSWDPKLKRPGYNHGLTSGLNHHKGFVATIDGRPYKAMLGSFNWSHTANVSNYEDLLEVDATKNDATKKLAGDYLSEFTAFFNHPDTLSADQAKVWKTQIFNELRKAHGETVPATPAMPSRGADYAPAAASAGFDVNSFASGDTTAISTLVGSSLAGKIQSELKANGRFDSLEDLKARVPGVKTLSSAVQAKLATLTFGDGRVSLNVADTTELVRAGFTSRQAAAIVAEREKNGAFESLDEMDKRVSAVASTTVKRMADLLSVEDAASFFSAKGFSEKTGTTGYAAEHAAAKLALANANGVGATAAAATLSNATVDLFRRAKPGDTVRVAMYGVSPNTPEYQEMMAANARGVNVRLLLNEGYNDPAVAALKAAINAGAKGLEVRIQTAKTLHAKFGVVNDDVFTGSGNFSNSASNTNSEDRFLLRNQPELAAQYAAQFETIWSKSKDV